MTTDTELRELIASAGLPWEAWSGASGGGGEYITKHGDDGDTFGISPGSRQEDSDERPRFEALPPAIDLRPRLEAARRLLLVSLHEVWGRRMKPYYEDEYVQLWHGDCRKVLHEIDFDSTGVPDLVVADPPYGETSLTWDRWPDGWLDVVADYANSMWCFGSMRMFLDRRDEFTAWKFAEDVVWSKPRGGKADRSRATVRTHEFATHWYRGKWSDIHHEQQRKPHYGPSKGTVHRGETGPAWNGARRAHAWTDDGTRALPSVIECQTMRMRGIGHPTEKPSGILEPLIGHGCPPGGLILDVFAGSGSASRVARSLGMRSIAIEEHEPYCELIVKGLQQDVLPIGGVM